MLQRLWVALAGKREALEGLDPNDPEKHWRDLGTEINEKGQRLESSFKDWEADTALRLERRLGQPLRRLNPVENPYKARDWIDAGGRTFDAIGHPNYYNFDALTGSINRHLAKQGVDYLVIDTTGWDVAQVAELHNFINGLSTQELARIMVLGLP